MLERLLRLEEFVERLVARIVALERRVAALEQQLHQRFGG
jgi:hypothetical protein